MLTIKSGKKGPQIKKGIIETAGKIYINIFNFLNMSIKL